MPEEEKTTALSPFISVESLMLPSQEVDTGEDAGLGSEDISPDTIIIPRVSLLQAMSKAITQSEADVPPQAGCWWLTPNGRPATKLPKEGFKFVVVRIYPVQRLWNPLDEGGGIICEATTGKLVAREPLGMAKAELSITSGENGEATDVSWSGGQPTTNCRECVYGPGASGAATKSTGKSTGWLPKYFNMPSGRVSIPDKLRAPRCQAGFDALVLALIPAVDGLPAELVPAFLTFARSGFAAGRTLAGMIRLNAGREAAWGKIYEGSSKKTTNDAGTFFVPVVRPVGKAGSQLAAVARDLFNASESLEHRPNLEDEEEFLTTDDLGVGGGTGPAAGVEGDAPAPDDQF